MLNKHLLLLLSVLKTDVLQIIFMETVIIFSGWVEETVFISNRNIFEISYINVFTVTFDLFNAFLKLKLIKAEKNNNNIYLFI